MCESAIMTDNYKINNSSYTWEEMYLIDMIGLNATKNTHCMKKYLRQKLCKIKFPKKNNIIMHWNEKVPFRAERCKKYRLYRKMLQIKVAWNKISSKKLSGCISLFAPRMELGGRQRFVFLKYNAQKCEENFYINLETSSSNSVG